MFGKQVCRLPAHVSYTEGVDQTCQRLRLALFNGGEDVIDAFFTHPLNFNELIAFILERV